MATKLAVNASAIRLCQLASHRCRGSSGSTGILLRTYTLMQGHSACYSPSMNGNRSSTCGERLINLRSHEQLPVLSGAALCPVFASTTSFRPSPVAFSLTPQSLLDGMKDKVASLNTSNAKTRLNFGEKNWKHVMRATTFHFLWKKLLIECCILIDFSHSEQRRQKTREMAEKNMKTRQFSLGSRRLVGMNFCLIFLTCNSGHCLIRVIIQHNHHHFFFFFYLFNCLWICQQWLRQVPRFASYWLRPWKQALSL